MKKARNRSDSEKPDQSLPRSKILRGRRNFERLFEKSTVLTSDSIQFRYRLYNNPSEGCLIGFIAPKKIISKAVQRNKAKRVLREVYRIHQDILRDLFSSNQFGFHGAFLVRSSRLTFSQVQNEMLPILKEIQQILLSYQPRQLKSEAVSATTPNSETKRT